MQNFRFGRNFIPRRNVFHAPCFKQNVSQLALSVYSPHSPLWDILQFVLPKYFVSYYSMILISRYHEGPWDQGWLSPLTSFVKATQTDQGGEDAALWGKGLEEEGEEGTFEGLEEASQE